MGQRFRISLIFLIICISTAFFRFGFPCSKPERRALLLFKHSFIDGSNDCLGSWVGEGCCSWKGVGCDNITGNVIKLDLGGELCSNLEAGEVNSALLQLKYLTYLDLSFVSFMGSRFPQFFGFMRKLEYLNLSMSQFSGNVPHNLGNLTDLVVLDLYNFGGLEIEANNLEWAFGLEKLQYLDLTGINLTQARQSLSLLLHHLPSLSVLNLAHCGLGNTHTITTTRNSTISYSPLQYVDLRGNFLTGPIPHFLQNMSSIRFLDLSFNLFSSPIPPWLGKVDLKDIRLAFNSFNGSFPHFVQNLSFLTVLDLSYNQFSSSVPSWLASNRYLKHLDLSHNSFDRVDGGIMSTFGHLCSLTYLRLSSNQLQEEVLESPINFSRCSRYDLQYLHMDYNNISGYLPIIGNLSSLLDLDLSHNNFETLPPSFGRLSSLSYLDLSYNNLSVVHQASLANLSSLISLDISSNSVVLDLSPDWMPPFQLESLSILPCKLNSPFPNWVLSQKWLSDLDLSDIGISGPLPINIGNAMPALQSLRLANNHINGSIPTSLCGIAGLLFLHLQDNALSGIIPDCWVYSKLVEVDLSSNKLFGTIPSSLIYSQLSSLRLNNNSLEGELPLYWGNSDDLVLVDVSMNKLHGEIPPWNKADFPSLRILILRENRFEGKIPMQLCSVQTLHIINLANNNLVGTIPRCFGYFKSMGYMLHSSMSIAALSPAPTTISVESPLASSIAAEPTSDLSAFEVIKGQEREYTTILDQLVNMDLSCNHLVGVIPGEITSLSLLLGLNLSHNHLNGTIPMEIGKMRSLESLDLSFNNLSGSIPETLSYLDSLSKMNFSFNNLQGQIPTGRHLQTLNDSSIYMGNPSLCGDQLPKKCFGDNSAHPPTSAVLENEGDNKREKMWFYMVIMLGFALGFWGVIGLLLFHKRWRHAYFQIAEELMDWIYVGVAVMTARVSKGR